MASQKETPSRGRPAQLSTERIVTCALGMGVGQLSMHKIAKTLGVSTTALYRHVASKEELIYLCADQVTGRVATPEQVEWQAYLFALARGYRTAALQAPGSVEFLRYVGLQTPHGLRLMDHSLGVMRNAGFEPEGAFMAVAGVVSHATDMVLHQELAERRAEASKIGDLTGQDDLPNVIWAMSAGVGTDHDRNFEVGLQIIVEGVKAAIVKG